MKLLCWLFLGILYSTVHAIVDDYAVVIDAGSTGSRCFVFHVTVDEDDLRTVTSTSCGKVTPGLSSFVDSPDDASENLAPLLHNAGKIVPLVHHLSTHVHIKATAGMRLLTPQVQHRLWQSLAKKANESPDIPFVIAEEHIGTIDGHKEAFYAVLASNYIAKSIDGNLQPIPGRSLLGAMDMGGSSTQLIFYNGTKSDRKIFADDFWSYSWLNYGAHKVQERVMDYIYESFFASTPRSELVTCSDSSDDSEQQCSLTSEITIPNPCGFTGQRVAWKDSVLVGTGRGHECFEMIERVIWPAVTNQSDGNSECFRGRPCPIEEIEHPSVKGHHFYAMSVYFYALDCVRQLGSAPLPNWPTPTLEEVENATFQFCEMDWNDVLERFNGPNSHEWTWMSQLPDRCFEALYIITLLERGFGFDRHDRSITYALEVEGSEVEWTLGFALAEVDFVPHHDKISTLARNGLQYFLAGKAKTTLALASSIANFFFMSVQSYSRTLYKRIRLFWKSFN